MIENTEIMEDVRQLMSFPSVTREKEERELFNWLGTYLQKFEGNYTNGVKISLHKEEAMDQDVFHGALVMDIALDDADGQDKIALMGHLDVVPVNRDKWDTDPFELVSKDAKLFGRGTSDMKSGVAIMIDMIRRAMISRPKKSFKCVFTTGEEKGRPNGLSLALDTGLLKNVNFAIALEPTEGCINLGIFGYYFGKFIFTGKACHSSEPQRGENAIYKACGLLEILQKKSWELENVSCDKGRVYSEVLESTTISGGNGENVIPGECVVGVNYRYKPGKTPDDAATYMASLAEQVGASAVEIIENNASSNLVDQNHPEVQKLIGATRGKITTNLVKFWSDIAQTSLAGIPSVNFGPGSIKQAHTDNEYIKLSDLEETHQTFISYLF